MAIKVFISSTSQDLSAYRSAAVEECIRLGMLPIPMELFEAMALGANAGSRRKLDGADLYVGIFAHRYGYVEPGHVASVTENEFDHAGERGIDRLCFLVRPDHVIESADEGDEARARLEAFKLRIESRLIRAQFTTVDDFRGKLRLALQEWQAGDAKARLPQPALSANLLTADRVTRLTYRARQLPFVGRGPERAVLERFLDATDPVAWLVVCGPGGVGKSRLVQEFCLSAGPAWRAGFLVAGQTFDWTTWRPNADTLLVIDYAAERVAEARAVLGALLVSPPRDARVRLLLVERDGEGRWTRDLIGARGDAHEIERARSDLSPLRVGGLAPAELCNAVYERLRLADRRLLDKDILIEGLRRIDPEGRPLFAALAADALAAGRDLRDWDRDRLLRDLLAREREAWSAAGADATYENLLALATAIGGDRESLLESGGGDLKLPPFRDFDRAAFATMTGCALDGDEIPALKPDLLGEFYVLEHVRGRNPPVAALRAQELIAAAWRRRGGANETKPFGELVTQIGPSSLVQFLTRVVEDFPDHPSLPLLLARPRAPGVDLRYWATLVSLGIRSSAMRGDAACAKALFAEVDGLSPDELRAADDTAGFIRSGLCLLPALLAAGDAASARAVVARVRALLDTRSGDHGEATAFCEGVADAVAMLRGGTGDPLVDELIDAQAALAAEGPTDQELVLAHARALAARVLDDAPLADRERSFERLRTFCETHRGEVAAFQHLAASAAALCKVYAGEPQRLADAERMNYMIRGLARVREATPLWQTTAPFSFEIEWVADDLSRIHRCLLESDANLVGSLVRAERFRESNALIVEATRIWHRFHRREIAFAALWAEVVVVHAHARASQGVTENVGNAVADLIDTEREFDGNPLFVRYASELVRGSVAGAIRRDDLTAAAALLDVLPGLATREAAPGEVVADFADASMSLYIAFQQRGEAQAALPIARRAAAALRSTAYRDRLLGRGADEKIWKQLVDWVDAVEAPGESGNVREAPR